MWWRKKGLDEPQVLRCSFCNKLKDDVEALIAGPRVFICGECVEVCNDIIADDSRVSNQSGKKSDPPLDRPSQWPNKILCALCRQPVSANEGLVLGGNRGTVCAECANAFEAARSREEKAPPEGRTAE
jgi:hypothetical protein